MLLLSGGVVAQEQFFDDIYYSGSNKDHKKVEEAEAGAVTGVRLDCTPRGSEQCNLTPEPNESLDYGGGH